MHDPVDVKLLWCFATGVSTWTAGLCKDFGRAYGQPNKRNISPLKFALAHIYMWR